MGHTVWDFLYDFLDEILASMMPGAYFISYFALLFIFFFHKGTLSIVNNVPLLSFCIVLSYCLGTVFRRSDMKKVDRKSAYYIYKKQDKDCGSFAFAETLKTSIGNLKKNFSGREGKCKLSTLFEEKNHDSIFVKIFMFLLPSVTSDYSKLYRYYKKLEKERGKNKSKELDGLATEIKKILFPQVDYPYTHLENYLSARDLSIKKFAQWNDNTRSKMKINTYKVEIASKAPHMMTIINKNEAHIRFMNSMWYASSALLFSASVIGFLSLSLLYLLLHSVSNSVFYTFFPQEYLVITITISLFYASASLFVKHRIKNIIHYQRVRELVFILTTYEKIQSKAITNHYQVRRSSSISKKERGQ